MKTDLKAGDQVKLIGSENVGTIDRIFPDGYALVKYQHGPDRVTVGSYPVTHLEKAEAGPPSSPALLPQEKGARTAAKKADILGSSM